MSVSSIGVQQILPRTGTSWQGANPAPDRGNGADGNPVAAPAQAPAAPGTGQIVDKIA